MTATLETLWQTYSTPIYGYLFKAVRDHDVTEDLRGIVYLRITVAYAGGHGYTTHESGWIWRIARNVLVDHWRAMHRIEWVDIEALAEQPADDVPLDEQVERSETVAKVRSSVERILPARQSDILQLRLEGYSQPEIAQMTGIGYGAVKQMCTRAYATLRERLQEATI